MPCEILPPVTPPELPLPLTIVPPALPTLPVNLNLCCKIVQFELGVTLPPFPPQVSETISAVIKPALATIRKYLHGIAIPCPKE